MARSMIPSGTRAVGVEVNGNASLDSTLMYLFASTARKENLVRRVTVAFEELQKSKKSTQKLRNKQKKITASQTPNIKSQLHLKTLRVSLALNCGWASNTPVNHLLRAADRCTVTFVNPIEPGGTNPVGMKARRNPMSEAPTTRATERPKTVDVAMNAYFAR